MVETYQVCDLRGFSETVTSLSEKTDRRPLWFGGPPT